MISIQHHRAVSITAQNSLATYLDKVAQDISRALEQRVALYLKPLAQDKAESFAKKAQQLDKWLDHLLKKAQETMRSFNDLTPELKKELDRLTEAGVSIQRSIRESVTDRIAVERSYRPWPWIVGTVIICVATIVGSGLCGAWINHHIEQKHVEVSQAVHKVVDDNN